MSDKTKKEPDFDWRSFEPQSFAPGQILSNQYPKLDFLALNIAQDVARRINDKVTPEGNMIYPRKYVLEEVIKILQAAV